MTDLLLDVNLQQLPDEYLTGVWRVADRVLNQANSEQALAVANTFVLENGALQLRTAQHTAQGQWAVQRDELLNRPYLRMQLPEQESRALITRLRRSSDGEQSILNLYFQSGMEVQLARP